MNINKLYKSQTKVKQNGLNVYADIYVILNNVSKKDKSFTFVQMKCNQRFIDYLDPKY